MKKTKLMMPILGIAAIGSAIAPLTALTSCNKAAGLKVELYNNTTLENKLYANSKTINLFFKQNNLNNVTKTRVKMVNLKINGAEAATVAGLTKITVDSAGGIRVTFNITTMYKHYSNPNSIEFDLLFYNNTNKQSCTVEGFKFNIDQDVEVPHPFATDGTVVKGFTEETEGYKMKDFAIAYPDIFVETYVPSVVAALEAKRNTLSKNKNLSILTSAKDDDDDEDPEEEVVTAVLYKMVIPAKFTSIEDNAFTLKDKKSNSESIPDTTLPSDVRMLEFAPGSKMESIGDMAFASAPFWCVDLPSSLKKLGIGCFAATAKLVSLHFAPTSNNKLTLPGGFLYKSSIPNLKLPTYIEKIDTYTLSSNGSIIPSILPLGNFVLDLMDWSGNQIKALSYTTDAIQIDSSASSICSASETAAIAEIESKFLDSSSKLIFDVCTNIFKYQTTSSTEVAIDLDNESMYLEIFASVLYASLAIVKEGNTYYYISRLEMPNYGVINGKQYKITSYSQNFLDIWKSNSGAHLIIPGLTTSYVFPKDIKVIPENFFVNSSALWKAYIPKSVTKIESGAFANTQLSSIIYEGTKAEWEQITLQPGSGTSLDWDEGCKQIVVECSDGTIIINPAK